MHPLTISDVETESIRVQIESEFVPERSSPENDHYFFTYHVEISNEGKTAAQLISRATQSGEAWLFSSGGDSANVNASGTVDGDLLKQLTADC